jgi:hypothetical protein
MGGEEMIQTCGIEHGHGEDKRTVDDRNLFEGGEYSA